MRMLAALVLLVVACGPATVAQIQTAAQKIPTQGVPPDVQQGARQKELNSVLHEKVAAAGGKLVEMRDARAANLSADLQSLFAQSDEVLLVHQLISYSGLSVAGDKVLSHFDVQVLQSWKGNFKTGNVVTFWVPAGGLAFSDGSQAGRRVRGFQGLRDGGRYVLFLHSAASSQSGTSSPSWWLVGDGVQGAFLLDDGKVLPAYQTGMLAKTYSGSDVSAFLAELNALNGGQR